VWTRRWRPLPSTISAFLTPLALPLRRLRSTVVQPFYLSSFFGFSIFAGRDPLVFVFVLEPSLRTGDPVAYLELHRVAVKYNFFFFNFIILYSAVPLNITEYKLN